MLFLVSYQISPTFYIVTSNQTHNQVYEVQVYSNILLLIGTSELNDPSNVTYFFPDVYARRSNFNGKELTLKRLFFPFMMDIFHLFQDEFNFETIFEDEIFGHQLENGSWSGSIGKLISKEHDLGADDFTLTSERLEVVEASEPMYQVHFELIYLRKNTHGKLTSLLDVLNIHFWLAIIMFMLIFLFIFIITTKFSMSKSVIAKSMLDSTTLIIKAFVGQGFDETNFLESHQK